MFFYVFLWESNIYKNGLNTSWVVFVFLLNKGVTTTSTKNKIAGMPKSKGYSDFLMQF